MVPALAFNVGRGFAWIKKKTGLVCHCDSLLPPCQPLASLSILPNHCDSCVALAHAVPSISPAQFVMFFVDHANCASVSSCRWLSAFLFGSGDGPIYLTFAFRVPTSRRPLHPFSSLPRVLAHSFQTADADSAVGFHAVPLTSLTRLITFITRPVRLQSQVLRPASLASPHPAPQRRHNHLETFPLSLRYYVN